MGISWRSLCYVLVNLCSVWITLACNSFAILNCCSWWIWCLVEKYNVTCQYDSVNDMCMGMHLWLCICTVYFRCGQTNNVCKSRPCSALLGLRLTPCFWPTEEWWLNNFWRTVGNTLWSDSVCLSGSICSVKIVGSVLGMEGEDIKRKDDSNWKRAQSGSFCYLTLTERIRFMAFLNVREIFQSHDLLHTNYYFMILFGQSRVFKLFHKHHWHWKE